MSCTCLTVPAWRIRKEPDEPFPWRIWRRDGDLTYEPVMRAATFHAALALVQGFIWLRGNALTDEGTHTGG